MISIVFLILDDSIFFSIPITHKYNIPPINNAERLLVKYIDFNKSNLKKQLEINRKIDNVKIKLLLPEKNFKLIFILFFL